MSKVSDKPDAERRWDRSDQRELAIILDLYDLTLYLIQRYERFPRHHPYGLGSAIKTRLQTLLGLLVRAKYSLRASTKSVLAVIEDPVEQAEGLGSDLRLTRLDSARLRWRACLYEDQSPLFRPSDALPNSP
jgi:hypothetical protein